MAYLKLTFTCEQYTLISLLLTYIKLYKWLVVKTVETVIIIRLKKIEILVISKKSRA